MKRLGCTLLVLGLGSLLLPLCGFQFEIINLMSDSDMPVWGISLVLILGGIVLLSASSSSKGSSRDRETTEANFSKLMQSGLTQGVVADIALGIDTNTTISSLLAVGMPESTAKTYVGILLDSFMKMPNEQQEKIRQDVKTRMETIDIALSEGLSKEVTIQTLMKAEGFTREQAESIVGYATSVYRIRKLRNQ